MPFFQQNFNQMQYSLKTSTPGICPGADAIDSDVTAKNRLPLKDGDPSFFDELKRGFPRRPDSLATIAAPSFKAFPRRFP